MVNIEFARNEIKQLYKGNRKWHKRVDRMPDNQVLAIYTREFINKKRKPEQTKPEEDLPF